MCPSLTPSVLDAQIAQPEHMNSPELRMEATSDIPKADLAFLLTSTTSRAQVDNMPPSTYKDHLLIVLWEPEPKDITAEINRRFPFIRVSYFCLQDASRSLLAESKELSKGTRRARYVFHELLSSREHDPETQVSRERIIVQFRGATILVTLSALPPDLGFAPKYNSRVLRVPLLRYKLRLVHVFSAGIEQLAKHPILVDSEIDVTTSRGIHGPPIAEWVLMTTLAFSKHYKVTYELQKEHTWVSNDFHFSEGSDWVGKTVGIAGYGGIGRQVARHFCSLGCTILAYTRSPRTTSASRQDRGYTVPGTGDPSGIIPKAWFSGTTKADWHNFLSQNLDVLVIALPLTPLTTDLLSTDEFQLLSKHTNSTTQRKCFLVNVARGRIIDQPAFVTALNNGLLCGAASDVTVPEPLPKEDPLWQAKNVTITPHVSAAGVEYQKRAYDVLITNLARREKGETMLNLFDRQKGY